MNEWLDHLRHGLSGQFLALAAAVTRTSEGSINWRNVFGTVVSAAILALAASTIEQGNRISAIHARQEIVLRRLEALETGNATATSERYRASDAARDLARISHDITDLHRRLDRIEDKLLESKKRSP